MSAQKIILLVDDEVDLVEMVSHHLTKKGYRVFTAHNGAEALQQLKVVTPDLVILDINMPKMGGIEFYAENITPHGRAKCPTLILSARANLEEMFEEIEADGFLSKPFDMERLIAEIERITNKETSQHVFILDNPKKQEVSRIKQALEKERYAVTVVEDVQTLQQRAKKKMPSFILIEYLQVDNRAERLINEIKTYSHLRDVPVIAYHYPQEEELAKKSLDAGAVKYLGAPENYEAFVLTIRELELNKKQELRIQ